MDIPLFSTARTIQKLKQKIQTYVEGEAIADFLKIDVILNATNNHTKDGTSKACLQILFRVFHRNRWVDSDFAPRKLKSILFLRAALNELEQEDLKDLIALRRAIGYGNLDLGGGLQQQDLKHQELLKQQSVGCATPVVNEAGEPVGYIGTSGNVYDFPGVGAGVGVGMGQQASLGSAPAGPVVGAWSQNELGAIYLTRDVAETVQRASIANALQQNGVSMPSSREHYGGVGNSHYNNTFDPHQQQQSEGSTSGSHSETGTLPGSPASLYSHHHQQQQEQQHRQRPANYNLDSRHVLVPETIQLSTNAANFQPFPNGFQFQR